MKIIGVTGSITAGKSTLSSVLAPEIPFIDCDIINSQLLEKKDVYDEVNVLFQLKSSREFFKNKLRELLLKTQTREKIEAYFHPKIFECVQKELKKRRDNGATICFIIIPILSQWIPEDLKFDKKISIECHQILRERRLLDRYGQHHSITVIRKLSERHSSLTPLRRAWATELLYNNASLSQWDKKCRDLKRQLLTL